MILKNIESKTKKPALMKNEELKESKAEDEDDDPSFTDSDEIDDKDFANVDECDWTWARSKMTNKKTLNVEVEHIHSMIIKYYL